MLTQYYHSAPSTVNRPYVPVAVRVAAPFMPAYGVLAPTVPPAQDASTVFAAAFLNLAAGIVAKSATHRWIGEYERGGRRVKGHWRAHRLVSRIPDAAIEAQAAAYDTLHGGM